MLRTAILVTAALLIGADAGDARRKVSLDEALKICTKRTERYEDSVRGPYMDYPEPIQVRDYYRSCVHAKSGSYAPAKYKSRRTRLIFK